MYSRFSPYETNRFLLSQSSWSPSILISKSELSEFNCCEQKMSQVQSVDQQTILFTIIFLLIGIIVALLFFPKKNDKLEKKPSVADISKGLQMELKGTTQAPVHNDDGDKVLSPSQFRSFKVLKITKISPNTKLFRFEIHPDKSLGLSIGRHISVRAEIDGMKVVRSYTPTSRVDQKGYFELLIKFYEFGKMSNYFDSLKVGQSVEIRGPVGRFKYDVNKWPTIGLIAAGTGITPCLQFIRSIFYCPDLKEDKTKLILFYQNRTEEDILLYGHLEELREKFPDRLQIVYFLSNIHSSHAFGMKNHNEKKGYISQDMINQFMQIEKCPYVCLCGPSGFNDSMKKLLTHAGHEQDKSIYVW